MNKVLIVLIVCFLVFFVWVIKNPGTNTFESEYSTESDNSLEGNYSPENEDTLKKQYPLEVSSAPKVEELKKFELPIIIDFGADWCPPCQQMKPEFKKLYKAYHGKAMIQYVDIDEFPEVAEDFPMQYIPTQTFFNKDGTPYAPKNAKELGLEFYYDNNQEHVLTMHVGVLTFEQMEQMLKEMGLDG